MLMRNNGIKAIDLFSGCGGVSCGLTQAGFNVVAAVELCQKAADVYKAYKPLSNVNVIVKNIIEVSGEEILAAGGINPDELYLLAGCPPCQNFSSQNRTRFQKTKEEKEVLLLEFLRVIKQCRPPFVLMENVPGIKAAEGGAIINEFIAELRNEKAENLKEKYIIKESVLNAADYGVPQMRKRFVLHAVRADINEKLAALDIEVSLPKQTHGKGFKPWMTVWDAIGNLPPLEQGGRYSDETIKNHNCAALSETNIKRIKAIRVAGGNRTGLPPELVLKCHKEYSGHKDVYGIMDANKPSPTITGGCLSYSKGRFGHPNQNRAISVREAARLQTFPDDFEFGDSLGKAALQIGNAVPVKLVEASGQEILKCIKALNAVTKD